MFRNVDIELKRIGKTKGDLARELNITPSTMSLKLNGKSDITLSEARKIKEFLGVTIKLDELFS